MNVKIYMQFDYINFYLYSIIVSRSKTSAQPYHDCGESKY